MPEKCARCGSDKMMEDVHLNADVIHPLHAAPDVHPNHRQRLVAYVLKNPDAWVFKGTVFGELRARVCGGCGHTEIYTTNFEELYQAYQQSHAG